MITQEDIDHFADMQSPIIDMSYYQQEAVKTAIYTDPIIYPALGLGNEAVSYTHLTLPTNREV